jgi:hypothetical protein
LIVDLASRKREYKKRHKVEELKFRSFRSGPIDKTLESGGEKTFTGVIGEDQLRDRRFKNLRNKLRAKRNNDSVREEALRELLLLLPELSPTEREKHLLFCLSAVRDIRSATLYWSDIMEGLLDTFSLAPSDQIVLAISEAVTFKVGDALTSMWAESLLRSSAKCDTELAHETLILVWSMTSKRSSLRKRVADELLRRFCEYPVAERIKSLKELSKAGVSRSTRSRISEALIECANTLPEISSDRDEALRLALELAPYFSHARHRIKTALKAWTK